MDYSVKILPVVQKDLQAAKKWHRELKWEFAVIDLRFGYSFPLNKKNLGS